MSIRISFATLLLWCAGCTGVGAPGSGDSAEALPRGASAAGLPASARPARRISFADLPDRGDLVSYPAHDVARQDGAYTWHRAGLSEEHALRAVGGVMQITTPAGERLQFQYERHVEHPSGDWTWIGRAKGGNGSDEVVLTFGELAVFGSISQPGRAPLKLTTRGGVAWLIETDRSRIAGIDGAATRPRKPDFLIPPKSKAGGGGATMESAPAAVLSMSAAGAQATATSTVDVLLGYTDGFAAAQGGQSQTMTRLYNMVEITNQAYVNSRVDARVRLVHAMQVSYPDNTSNQSTLEALTGFQAPSTRTTPDPVFAALRSARDQYGADLVSLVRDFTTPENGGCGIAWLVGGDQQAISVGDQEFGYSVISDGTDAGVDGKTYLCREETLAHELGHNMGSQHGRATATVGGTLHYGAYPYSFGLKTAASSGNFYTVMAYGDSGQVSYRTFSNPRTTFCGGYPCGIPDEADNARSLGQTIPVVAQFRATVVPATTGAPRNDMNGDGRSDLLWHDGYSLGFWWMDGATVLQASNQFVGAGFEPIATGDLTGDGRVDVLLRGLGGDMHLWRSDGSRFLGQQVNANYPSGWRLVSTGDVDGNGTADLLWHDGVNLGYWNMSGASVTRTAMQFVGSNFVPVATGDFTGDGRVDVVWKGSGGDLHLWSSNGTSFTGQQISANYPGGWNLISAGDIDGDGKADLIWHDGVNLGYWLMNGASVRRSAGLAVGSGYKIASVGDMTGDGLIDVIWRGAGGDLHLWRSTGSSFAGQQMSANYPFGWTLVPGSL